MIRYVPNLLSGARLVAAPYIFALLWSRRFTDALVWIFVIGVTDGIDGWVARRFNAASRVGAMLDPVADKVLLSGSFLVLGLLGSVPAWLVWLVLGRDAAILLFAVGVLLTSSKRREFPPTQAGKWSTAFQILYILTVIAAEASLVSSQIPAILQWVVLLVTGWSSIDYAQRAFSRQPHG